MKSAQHYTALFLKHLFQGKVYTYRDENDKERVRDTRPVLTYFPDNAHIVLRDYNFFLTNPTAEPDHNKRKIDRSLRYKCGGPIEVLRIIQDLGFYFDPEYLTVLLDFKFHRVPDFSKLPNQVKITSEDIIVDIPIYNRFITKNDGIGSAGNVVVHARNLGYNAKDPEVAPRHFLLMATDWKDT